MIHYNVYNSFKKLPESWNAFVKHDVFLQTHYLQAVEEASPNNIQLFYVGVFKDQVLVGVVIVQGLKLYLKDMFRRTNVSCVKSFFQNIFSKIIKGHILVVGNMMHTGQHGVFYKESEISKSQFFDSIFLAIEVIKSNIWNSQNQKIRAILLKDYFQEDAIHKYKPLIDLEKLHKVSVQPNMLISVKPEWLSMEDYIAALNKKYKDRFKRARKKFNGIKSVELSLEDIKNHTTELYDLYVNVSNNADFNTFILPENHFYSLKLQLKNDFKVYGYYLKDELVGFYTLILNNTDLETYFLGYDEAHQYPNQLYLNMLYDMLKFGIENKFKTIVYARTAMEIKSSVGAKAKPMSIYIKHTSSLLNIILKWVFKFMNPSQDWHERHPFK